MPELYLYTNIHWSRVNDKKVNAVGLFDTIHQLCVALLYLNDILMCIVSFLMCTYVTHQFVMRKYFYFTLMHDGTLQVGIVSTDIRRFLKSI